MASSEDSLAFMQVQYAIIGFVTVMFNHDMSFAITATLLLSLLAYFPADVVAFEMKYQFVYAVRLVPGLVTGAAAASALVYALSMARILHTPILLVGNSGTSRSDRKSKMVVHSCFVIFLVFSALLLLIGTFYCLGSYNSPTFGSDFEIGDGSGIADQMCPGLTSLGAILSVAILVLMAIFEYSGIGAMTSKYIIALVVLFVPLGIINVSEDIMDAATSGAIGLAMTVVLWLAFPFYAQNVAFKPKLGKVDALYHNPRKAWIFAATTGIPHVVMLAAGYGMDIGLSSEADRFIWLYYTSIAAPGAILLAAIIIAAINGKWRLSLVATRDLTAAEVPLMKPEKEKRSDEDQDTEEETSTETESEEPGPSASISLSVRR